MRKRYKMGHLNKTGDEINLDFENELKKGLYKIDLVFEIEFVDIGQKRVCGLLYESKGSKKLTLKEVINHIKYQAKGIEVEIKEEILKEKNKNE